MNKISQYLSDPCVHRKFSLPSLRIQPYCIKDIALSLRYYDTYLNLNIWSILNTNMIERDFGDFFFCPSKEKEGTEKDNSKKNLLDINNRMRYKALSGLLVVSSLFIDLMSEVYYSVLNNC